MHTQWYNVYIQCIIYVTKSAIMHNEWTFFPHIKAHTKNSSTFWSSVNLWKRRIHTREKTTLYLLCYTCKNYARTFIFYRKGWAKPLAITNDARRASAIEKVRGAFILACFSFPFTDLSLSFSRSLPSTFAFDRKRERKREADFRLEGNEYFYLLFVWERE